MQASSGRAHAARGYININHTVTPLAAVVNKQDAFCDTVATGSALSLFNQPATPSDPVHPAAIGGGSTLPPPPPHPEAAPKPRTGVREEGAGAAPNGGPITNCPPPQWPCCTLRPNGERLRYLQRSDRNMALRPALGSLAVSFAGLRAGALSSRGPSHARAPAAARGNDRGGREGSPL